jgi:transcriptional pleiotropic regulator of transition state genes
MKALGIVRPMDGVGRVILPKEVRRFLDINKGTRMEFLVGDDSSIILQKHYPNCIICGGKDDNKIYNLKYICNKCIEGIKQL